MDRRIVVLLRIGLIGNWSANEAIGGRWSVDAGAAGGSGGCNRGGALPRIEGTAFSEGVDLRNGGRRSQDRCRQGGDENTMAQDHVGNL
jgi:hypothetical protein